MCISKLQRILTAIMLSLILYFFISGNIIVAAVLQVFVILIMLVWATTNFCPLMWIMKKFFSSCN